MAGLCGHTSLLVESVGVLVLWRSVSPWMALGGAALTGFGFSLVFPAMGVEAVRHVPERSRGTALGVYTVFADVSFFLVGPLAGAVIGGFGYSSAFLFALLCVLAALGIVAVLAGRESGRWSYPEATSPEMRIDQLKNGHPEGWPLLFVYS